MFAHYFSILPSIRVTLETEKGIPNFFTLEQFTFPASMGKVSILAETNIERGNIYA